MAKLKEEISVVEDEVNQATKSIDEMKATKERLSTAGDVDCDEAVVATAPVFKQLLQGTVWRGLCRRASHISSRKNKINHTSETSLTITLHLQHTPRTRQWRTRCTSSENPFAAAPQTARPSSNTSATSRGTNNSQSPWRNQ